MAPDPSYLAREIASNRSCVFHKPVPGCVRVKRTSRALLLFRWIVAAARFSSVAIAGTMMQTKATTIELDMNKLKDVLRRAEATLNEEDYAMVKDRAKNNFQVFAAVILSGAKDLLGVQARSCAPLRMTVPPAAEVILRPILTELERHAGEASANPQHRMPWNYRQTRAGSSTPPDTAR